MKNEEIHSITRRGLMKLLGVGGAVLGTSLPAFQALAQSRKTTLVIGMNTADTTELDPVRDLHLTPPMTISACYECLITMHPGDYSKVHPELATSWARTPDGKGWRFKLQPGLKFVSGNPVTAQDVKFSLDRVRYIAYQAAQYVKHIDSVNVVDDLTVDVMLKNPNEPILTILAAPSFAVTDSKVIAEHGGDASPESKDKDKATEWLNQNSAGTGAYKLVGWVPGSQIQLVGNPDYRKGKPPFDRVVVRHFEDSAAQLLALRRGDIDVAFNLIPEQVDTLKSEPNIRVDSVTSLDFVYLALTHNAELNKALANQKARQAIGHAIDYDGIGKSLLGGFAVRPASFLPIGTLGSSAADAERIRMKEDLGMAKQLLAEAGLADGFEFDLQYGNAAIFGTSYQVLTQKLQSDLGRVGIKVNLKPMPVVNMRTLYNGAKATSVVTHWNPPAVDSSLWALATVQRVAKRLGWTPPDDLVKLVDEATSAQDEAQQKALWIKYQEEMVKHANLLVLFQPIYRVGVTTALKELPLTAAGWQLDIDNVEPA